MEIKQKEIGENVILNFDYKNYKSFLSDLKDLGKVYEFKSNKNKLTHSVVFNARKKPYMDVKGWCSRVIDKSGRITEIVFVDYDRILYHLMKSELLYIQNKHNLTPFYVFKTFEDKTEGDKQVYGNYLAISIIKCSFKKAGEILDELHCDNSYKIVPKSYAYSTWVLRLGNKGKKGPPEFKEVIGDLKKEYKQECSNAHLEVLQKLYKIPKIKYKHLDNNHKVYLSEYKTASL